MLIDLAPNHKVGLVVENPILLAGGAIGYGEAAPKGLDTALLGAVVVGPVLHGSRGGAAPPRLAHLNGGAVLDTGLQNRGANHVLQNYPRLWQRMGCPVVVQLADEHPTAIAKVAIKLAEIEGIGGLELALSATADERSAAALIEALARRSDLPIWVKVPLARATALAPVALAAGAVSIVVGQPLVGAALRHGDPAQTVRGSVYGPLAFAPMMETLHQVNRLQLPCALIACGGIHTVDQVRQALAAGARAVQLDSALWVEPGLPGRLAGASAAS